MPDSMTQPSPVHSTNVRLLLSKRKQYPQLAKTPREYSPRPEEVEALLPGVPFLRVPLPDDEIVAWGFISAIDQLRFAAEYSDAAPLNYDAVR